MGRPGDDARMAKMRARRAPFTDARDGRLKKQIRWAFRLSGGEPLTTTELVKKCYWRVNLQVEKIKSWHRTNVSPSCRSACHSDRPRDEPGAADHVVTTA